ncbi:hypothetical protein BGZ76_003795, partial [Entomortierella beljakovae]
RLTALERRRATHILDERQRRDTMNQLLSELSSLVQESATEAANPYQNQILVPVLTPDGRPAVKSNSITTLRGAIAEIHRLREQVGNQDIATSTQTSPSHRRLSELSTSSTPPELSCLSAFAELASQRHYTEFNTNSSSDNPSPMSSPRSNSTRELSPTESISNSDISMAFLNSPPLSPSEYSSQNGFPAALPPIDRTIGTHNQPPMLPLIQKVVDST